MSPEQLARLLAQSDPEHPSSDLDRLDERELEAFSILAQGYSTGQAEREFGIQRAEFQSLKARIQKKLGLKDEVALLRRAAQQGRPE